jgi:hypothetical protein
MDVVGGGTRKDRVDEVQVEPHVASGPDRCVRPPGGQLASCPIDMHFEHARLRQERSVEIMTRIHRWAFDKRALPDSALGKAIAYLGSMRPGLQLFLSDPAAPIDNNGVERALCGVFRWRRLATVHELLPRS